MSRVRKIFKSRQVIRFRQIDVRGATEFPKYAEIRLYLDAALNFLTFGEEDEAPLTLTS